jgi:uncharacterized membrane protein
VLYRFETPFLNAQSPIWQHFAKVKWLLIPHGLGGAFALFIAPFQFSTRLRQNNIRLHRLLGYFYMAGTLMSAPMGIVIAVIQGPPVLIPAATIQATGWLLTTAIAFYFVRNGKIQQHREWMTRSYPFAMVFIFARFFIMLPPIERMGETGIVAVVWTVIALACFLPTFVIQWRTIFPGKAPVAVKQAVAR